MALWMPLSPMQRKLKRERMHFAILRSLKSTDFAVIKYLYDRLNIIDSKAQGLLTRNGLLLTVVSIVGSVKLRGDASGFLDEVWEQWFFAAGFVLLMTSTLLTFPIVLLAFDNITVIPSAASTDPADDALARLGEDPLARETERDCGVPRSFEEYVETFFEITINRQRLLRNAQRATITASYLFFPLIGYLFWQKLPHLQFRTAAG